LPTAPTSSRARASGSTNTADRRTELAADRTVFAAERTYAAWVRNGLFTLASGVGSKKLLTGLMPEWLIIAAGSVLLLFSAFCFVVGVWRNLNPGAPPPRPDVRRLPPYLLVGVNGFLILVVAAAFGRNLARQRRRIVASVVENGIEAH
jgi:putative membrane protein